MSDWLFNVDSHPYTAWGFLFLFMWGGPVAFMLLWRWLTLRGTTTGGKKDD